MLETMPLKASLIATLSAPVKPRALTRLTPSFELKLVEALIILDYVDEAYYGENF